MFAGLESRLSEALFGIPGVKGIEFGSGFRGAESKGSENNDSFLVADGAVAELKRSLLPLATVITPNLPEAAALCGRYAPAEDLARELCGTYGCAVLVKGGHCPGADAVDVLCDGGEVREFSLPWVANPVSTHGTGCSLAAALAAELALGRTLADAVAGAKRYVRAAIAGSHLVGPECGVLGFVKDVLA